MIHIQRSTSRRLFNMGKFVIRRTYPGRARNDRNDYGLGPLGPFDHSTLEPGFTIGMHPHANDEILSYMRRGTMYHRDSEGIEMPINHAKMMMMNAGKVIFHEEDVPVDAEPIDMLQIFFRPHTDDLKPMVQFADFEDEFSDNKWRWIGGPERSDAPLKIRSESWLHDARLADGATILTPELGERTGYLYVFSGSVELPDYETSLQRGDGFLVDHEQVKLVGSDEAEIVFFMVDETAPYSRNGMYSG